MKRKMAVSNDKKDYRTYFVEEDIDNDGYSTYLVYFNEFDEEPKYSIKGATRFLSLFDFVK